MEEIEIKPIKELPPRELNGNIKWTLQSITHDVGKLSYEDFFNNHMRKNIPCIIKNISSEWECTKKWVRDGKIDHEYLTNEYGTLNAPVADCSTKLYDTHCKKEMKVADYMTYLKTEPRPNLLYLKDWHLNRLRPRSKFYTVPKLFASDWLNEYAVDKQEDDFMFVYIGAKNSWTPLHSDVYSSFSWSVNIVGKKKWILLPPAEEIKLKDKRNNLPMTFDPKKNKNVKYYEIIQEKGDALFVPSNWYHQVVNLEDTISINHNWVNGCNLDAAWKALTQVLVSSKKEIDDLKDLSEYPSLCQKLVKCLYGMDFEKFVKWITYIGEKRLSQLQGSCSREVFNTCSLGTNLIKYDLKCILNVINLVETHPTFVNHEFKVVDNFLTLKDFLRDYYAQ